MTQFKTKSCWEYIVLSLSIKDPNISYAKKAKAAEKGRKRRRGGGTAQGDVDCAYISRGVLTVEKISIETYTLWCISYFLGHSVSYLTFCGDDGTLLCKILIWEMGMRASPRLPLVYRHIFSFRGPDVATVVGF